AVVPAYDTLHTFLVLEQKTAAVWGFSITDEAVAAAEKEIAVRHLRQPASDADVTEAIDEGHLCVECHDGFVNDDRFVWDSELERHPEGIVPDRELPTFFPLDEQGRIVCSTCHSPHGVSTVEEVRVAHTSGDVHKLVRHAPGQEMFTRMSREDSALCIGCHEDAAHERAVDELGVEGRTHPVGPELIEALEEREDTGEGGDLGLPPGITGGCLTCHAVHGATHAGLSRGADQGEVCMACHRESGDPARNHPLGLDLGRDFRVPRKTADLPMTRQGHTCRTCHDLVGGIGDHMIRVPMDGGLLCISCHEPEKASGPHGSKEVGDPLPCVGCHQVHEGNPKARLLRTLGSATSRDPQGCLYCHGAGGRFAEAGVRPGKLGHPVDVEDLSCAKCHDEHQPDLDLPSCRSCHEEEGVEEDRGGHGGAECLDCHPMHRASPRYVATDVELNPVSRRCLGCHAPGTDGSEDHVTLYEHPLPIFKPDGTRWSPLGKLPLFDSRGNQVISGQNGELTCTSCHLVHGPDAEKPGDNLRIPGWQDACSACHGADALLIYRYFHEPERRDGLGTMQ
ncbi:MAG: cytochrome c3 family protein, partial [Deltaproteobacteria bacterium]|nr:cytochrome c3 family protein [Deltaproteobacteria bacterium]